MSRALLPLATFVASLLAALIPESAVAQASPSDFTSAIRYDAARRPTGTIAPDPDGAGPLHYQATRTTYDAAGRPILIEKGELAAWQPEIGQPGGVAPAGWTGFTVFSQVDMTYDVTGRKLVERVSSGGTAYALTQYSYDSFGRLDCTAVRMNPATYGALPSSACTPGSEGSQGPDRITRNVYDAAGQVLKVQKAYGTALQQDYASYAYNLNGKQTAVIDANGNRATYAYDGFDRLAAWYFPSVTTPGAASTTDYEAYSYDANGNRTALRKRDGRVIGYSYDALNRVTVKTINGACVSGYACSTPPSWALRNVYYDYDLRGLQTGAHFDSASGADAVLNAYDGFGRQTSSTVSMGGVSRTVGHLYDADGNRIRVTHPEGIYFTYAYDGLDRPIAIKGSGVTQVAGFGYDTQGRQVSKTLGAVPTIYSYDAIGRLVSQTDNFTGTTYDQTSTFSYNPASQIVGRTSSNDTYAFKSYTTASTAYTANGLNQYATVGAGTLGYDANGNLMSNGGTNFTYDVENRLVSASGTLTADLVYDPLGRLFQTSSPTTTTTQFLYDGDEMIGEYQNGAVWKSYVHGAGADDPLLVYGSDLSNLRSMQADYQGSIYAIGNVSGGLLIQVGYDEYGVPDGAGPRFQYTGQMMIPELGMYYYKARIYSSRLGRFMQTDPIGYKDQNNLYAYVGNDPIDGRDPTGKFACGPELKGAACWRFQNAQNATIVQLRGSLSSLRSLRTAIKHGDKLTAGQRAIEARISKFLGKGAGGDVSQISNLISTGEKIMGALQSNYPVNPGSDMTVYATAPRISAWSPATINPPYWAQSNRTKIQTWAHEGGHFGAHLRDWAYGETANARLARDHPNLAGENADSVSMALGFERDDD